MLGFAHGSTQPLYRNHSAQGKYKQAPAAAPGPSHYVALSPLQLLSVPWLFSQALVHLTLFDVRIFFALLEVWQRRVAGQHAWWVIDVEEVRNLVGSRDHPKRVQASIKKILALGVFPKGEHGYTLFTSLDQLALLTPAHKQACALWVEAVSRRRHWYRVPRVLLRFLAHETARQRGLMALLLDFITNDAWWSVEDGVISGRAILIPAHTKERFTGFTVGIGLRQLRNVIARGTQQGWLHRNGSETRVILDRTYPLESHEIAPPNPGRGTSDCTPLRSLSNPLCASNSSNPEDTGGTNNAPEKEGTTGEPENVQTAKEADAQEAQDEPAEPTTTQAAEPRCPTLRDVQVEDLGVDAAVQQFYQEACARGWLRRCEAHELFAFAAAEHALHVPDIANRGGLFYELLRAGPRGELAAYITDADEDRARERLRALREPSPARPLSPVVKLCTSARDPTPSRSKDAQLVALIIAGLRQVGWRGDPFLAFKSHELGRAWTRERWNVAYADWQHWQHWHGGRDGP